MQTTRVAAPSDADNPDKDRLRQVGRKVRAALNANRKVQRVPVDKAEIWVVPEFFDTIDLPALMPLPAEPYQYAEWRRARVAPDYHVEVQGHFYSVPSRMIRQVVEVRATEATIEVFHRGTRIASHARSASLSSSTR